MKRIYLSMLTAVAVAMTILTPSASAQVSGWHKPGEISPGQSVVRPQKSAAQKFQERRGIVPTGAKIQPIIEGEFALPSIKQSPERVIRKTVDNPRASLYGVVPRSAYMETWDDAFLAKIDPRNRAVSPLYYGSHYLGALGNSDYMLQGSAYRNGKIYVTEYSYQVPDFIPVWHIVDLATGNVEETISFESNHYANAYAMTWDSEKDLFYLLSVNNSDANSHLIVVNPNNWEVKYIKDLGSNHFCPGIVYNPLDKETYVFDLENQVFTVDTETGALTKTGELDFDYPIFEDGVNAAICYSPMDQQFVYVYRDMYSSANTLMMIDPETWEVSELGTLGGRTDIYISSIICNDDFAEADAPELPAMMSFDFNKAATSGKISFSVPFITYYGVEIPSSMKIKAVLSADGKQIHSAEYTPGQNVTVDVTLPTGLHALELTCYLGTKQSPVRHQNLFVGNDNPKAPANLEFKLNKLTWAAPNEVGEHDGYVDTAALTYDIYVDGTKQNVDPVTECQYTLKESAEAKRSDIKVVAVANGMESQPASLNLVFGKAFSIPFGVVPTKEQSELFTIVNSNEDFATWLYSYPVDKPDFVGMMMPMSTMENSDDWLFLPPLNFDNEDIMYELSFDINSPKKGVSTESIDITVGNSPDPASATRVVYSSDVFSFSDAGQKFSINFCPPTAGTYYIGIHDRSILDTGAKGMFIRNFKVVPLEGTTTMVPDNPTKVNIIPASSGANAATLEVTMPTKSLTGKNLDPNEDLKATVTTGNYTAYGNAKPGMVATVEIPTDTFGFHNFNVVLSNSNGAGMVSTYNTYIGIDKPFPPTNIRKVISDDNLSMQLYWDAPSNVGVNGGFVDVDNLIYDIYIKSGVQYTTVGSTTKTTAKFETTVDKLTSYITGPAARNEAGTSSNSRFVQEVLGKPYEIPALEQFNTVNFSYYPYSNSTANEYANSEWENMKSPASLGLEGCIPNQGCLVTYSGTGMPTKSRVTLPKLSTLGYEDVNLVIRYWSYVLAPAMDIYYRTNKSQEPVLLQTVSTRGNTAQWKESVIKLPAEVVDKPWVEFQIETSLSGNTMQYLVIDSWEVSADCDYDLKLMDITGPAQVSVGDNASFNVSVANAGHLRNSGKLITQLSYTNGTIVATDEVTIPNLSTSQEFVHPVTFEIGGEFLTRNNLQITATVKADQDELPYNNSRNILVTVKDCQLPVVNMLRGSLNSDNAANITWINPNTNYGDFQDFEIEEPYQITEQIGAWQNIDVDKVIPSRIVSGDSDEVEIKWPDSNLPCAWTVISPDDFSFVPDSRMKPHSGKQYVMARSVMSADANNPTQASDWLISPEVKGGSEISFWYSTIASDYKEFVYLYYSNSGTNLDPENATALVNGDFVRLRSFSKVGEDAWEQCTYTLPADAKYFALVYTSFDSLGAMIDDISFSPLNMQRWDIDHFELHRIMDGEDVTLSDNLTERKFVDDTLPANKQAKYYVVTVVNKDGRLLSGPRSNIVAVAGPEWDSVNAVYDLNGIYGGKGTITLEGYAGKNLNVYTADGRLVMNLKPQTDNARYSVAAGLYLISDGRGKAKVFVK